MKKNILLLLALLCSITITQAQKNKKQANPAAAATTDDKGWKPTKGDTRNPFDTNKTKQVKANGLGGGEDPFGKKGKSGNKMTAEVTDELNPNDKATARSRKGMSGKKGNIANGMEAEDTDSLKVKKVKANGLGDGEDPFDKTGKLKGELTTYKSSTARSHKGMGGNVSPGQPGYDSLKVKPGKANSLGEGDDPFDKTGGKRKKTITKKNGYANQEVNYAKPNGAATPSQNQTTPVPVKGKKQSKRVTANQ